MRVTPLHLLSEDLVWREIEGELVLLDLRSSLYLTGNRSACVLWDALVAGAERQELIDLLCGSFEVEASRAAEDVDRFLEELAERDLLEP